MAKVVNLGGGAFSLSQDEGEATKVNTNPYRVKLTSRQTNGQFMMMEGIVLPGEGIVTKSMYTVLFFLRRTTCAYTLFPR